MVEDDKDTLTKEETEIAQLLAHEVLHDVPKDPSVEGLELLVALERGNALVLNIMRLDQRSMRECLNRKQFERNLDLERSLADSMTLLLQGYGLKLTLYFMFYLVFQKLCCHRMRQFATCDTHISVRLIKKPQTNTSAGELFFCLDFVSLIFFFTFSTTNEWKPAQEARMAVLLLFLSRPTID
jgi:hypothetical protein